MVIVWKSWGCAAVPPHICAYAFVRMIECVDTHSREWMYQWMCESAFRHIGKRMFSSSNVCQDNQTTIPIDIKLNAWMPWRAWESVSDQMCLCQNEESCVQMSDSMCVRTNIPANINLNESAYMSADVYVAKLVHGRSLSLIFNGHGTILPRSASKWREIESGQFGRFLLKIFRRGCFFQIFSLKIGPPSVWRFGQQSPNLVISRIFCNFNKAIAEASNAGRSHSLLFSW